jgi:hypothetical protein
MGAGILPVVLHNSALFFLMGKESYNNLWCDFGGSKNTNEKIFDTAIREGGEELNGLMGINKKLYNKVEKNLIMDITNREKSPYTSFLFKTEYDEKIIDYFNNSNEFAEYYYNNLISDNNGLFEKKEIKWFSINELNSNIQNFRPHYQYIVNRIIYNEYYIKRKIINSNKYKT